jgi:uncharacterized membrane protein YsdA (DUF1294 family)
LQIIVVPISSTAMPAVPGLIELALYLGFVNIATMAAFWRDKHCARKGFWRIPERTLLTMAFAGGTLGAIAAQHALRHKTHKEPFRTILYSIAGIHLAAASALSLPTVRTAFWTQAHVSLAPEPQSARALGGECHVRVIDARRRQIVRETTC